MDENGGLLKSMFIGVAGGTGAGKSTLCTSLMDTYPDRIGLIQLDDYFKPEREVPIHAGHSNWDHPDAIYFDKLVKDLENLSDGESIIANTKNDRLNPEYVRTGKRIAAEFHPKEIMLVEGFLVLFEERIRNLLTTSIWLEGSHEVRWKRRVHFKNNDYEENVLPVMYKKFALPSKKFAEHIFDAEKLNAGEIFKLAESICLQYITKA